MAVLGMYANYCIFNNIMPHFQTSYFTKGITKNMGRFDGDIFVPCSPVISLLKSK